jgi:hypothetical protein
MEIRGIFFVLVCLSVLPFAGCETLIGDAIWIDEQTVQVNHSSSDECIKKAISEIKEVTIDEKLSTPTDIVLKLRQEKPNRNTSGHVRRLSQTTVKVFFTGKGTKEPEDVSAEVKPILNSIGGAIQRECGQ